MISIIEDTFKIKS